MHYSKACFQHEMGLIWKWNVALKYVDQRTKNWPLFYRNCTKKMEEINGLQTQAFRFKSIDELEKAKKIWIRPGMGLKCD